MDDLHERWSTAETVHGYGRFGETKDRDLASGDIRGLQELYGP